MKGTREDAFDALRKLNAGGFTAYLAGGCVRDLLLGREPGDYDIATSATPEEVQQVFRHSIPVGKSFGVVKIVYGDNRELDVATFRVDGQYSDNRRPDSVAFTASAEEDVKRRDFTINGMLMDVNEQILDHVGGRADLEAKIIRTIGDPAARFGEDALRMMRAIRFATKYSFGIDPSTWNSISQLSATIKNISAERVTDELSKSLTCGNTDRAFILLHRSKLWTSWFEHAPNDDDCWQALGPLSQLTNDDSFVFALAILLVHSYDYRKESHLKRLVLTNTQKAELTNLWAHIPEMRAFLRRGLSQQRKMLQWDDLAVVERFIDIQSWDGKYRYEIPHGMTRDAVDTQKAHVRRMGWPAPLINGKWLIANGWVPGEAFSVMLEEVRNKQLENDLVFEDSVREFLLREFPCAPRMVDGTIVDLMRPRRVAALCNRCSRVMSYEVPRDAKGNWLWLNATNPINAGSARRSFVHCGSPSCVGKKLKRAFKEIVD